MISKNLIDSTMEIPITGPSKQLSKYITYVTDLAKTKYNVDMGPLFTSRPGIKLADETEKRIGTTKFTTKMTLVPNDAAFNAIDNSKQAEVNRINRDIAKEKQRMIEESYSRQTVANEFINEIGDVVPPPESFLPEINIEC